MIDSQPHQPATGRRRVLLMGLAGAAALLAGPAAAAVPRRSGARTLAFQHLHTGESLRIDYWAKGDYVTDALAQLDRLLRDFRTGEQMCMDRGLFDLLHALRGQMDSTEPFQIISGYRSPRTNAMLQRTAGGGVASHSLHMDGMALDIRLPGRRTADLSRAARALKAGGVGYYPKSNFVHVDTGRVRYW